LWGGDVARRLGFVGIIVEQRAQVSGQVNQILSDHADIIVARTGLPKVRDGVSIITLVVDATTDELGKLTGTLGALPLVSVKSGLAKER
jgi:putative iron-only hydrogenase system regulator